jgi:hypothetical protein
MIDIGEGGQGEESDMTEGDGQGMPASQRGRQETIDALCQAFAEDRLDMGDFERRVELAHRAGTAAELRALLSGLETAPPLPATREPAAAPAPRRTAGWSVAEPDRVQEQNVVMGVLGGGVRKGAWRPARFNYAVGVWGGVELDFRESVLPPYTEVRCFAVMGGVELIVPPDVIVDTSGIGILGGFEHSAANQNAPAGAPVIRVTGLAFMGGVDVQVREAGESAGDARRRKKMEAKLRRRLERGR